DWVELVAVVWVPRVRAAELAVFEKSYVSIRDWQPDGSLAPAGNRDEYYPIAEVVFGTKTAFGRGTDLSTHPVLRTTLAEATAAARTGVSPDSRDFGRGDPTPWVRYPATVWAEEDGLPHRNAPRGGTEATKSA